MIKQALFPIDTNKITMTYNLIVMTNLESMVAAQILLLKKISLPMIAYTFSVMVIGDSDIQFLKFSFSYY